VDHIHWLQKEIWDSIPNKNTIFANLNPETNGLIKFNFEEKSFRSATLPQKVLVHVEKLFSKKKM
jgi:hypothetical protein